MKSTLIFVTILLQVIYGDSASNIAAQSPNTRYNLDELRSKLPGFYPGFFTAGKDKPPTTKNRVNWGNDHAEMRNTQAIDFHDGKRGLVSSERLRQAVFENFQEPIHMFGNFLKCAEKTVRAKASKRLQKDAVLEAIDFWVMVLKCVINSVDENMFARDSKRLKQ